MRLVFDVADPVVVLTEHGDREESLWLWVRDRRRVPARRHRTGVLRPVDQGPRRLPAVRLAPPARTLHPKRCPICSVSRCRLGRNSAGTPPAGSWTASSGRTESHNVGSSHAFLNRDESSLAIYTDGWPLSDGVGNQDGLRYDRKPFLQVARMVSHQGQGQTAI